MKKVFLAIIISLSLTFVPKSEAVLWVGGTCGWGILGLPAATVADIGGIGFFGFGFINVFANIANLDGSSETAVAIFSILGILSLNKESNALELSKNRFSDLASARLNNNQAKLAKFENEIFPLNQQVFESAIAKTDNKVRVEIISYLANQEPSQINILNKMPPADIKRLLTTKEQAQFADLYKATYLEIFTKDLKLARASLSSESQSIMDTVMPCSAASALSKQDNQCL
jgi:hypothetical protein